MAMKKVTRNQRRAQRSASLIGTDAFFFAIFQKLFLTYGLQMPEESFWF